MIQIFNWRNFNIEEYILGNVYRHANKYSEFLFLKKKILFQNQRVRLALLQHTLNIIDTSPEIIVSDPQGLISSSESIKYIGEQYSIPC